MEYVVHYFDELTEAEFWGAGETPQDAWNDLLEVSEIDRDDIDQNDLTWFVRTNAIQSVPVDVMWIDNSIED